MNDRYLGALAQSCLGRLLFSGVILLAVLVVFGCIYFLASLLPVSVELRALILGLSALGFAAVAVGGILVGGLFVYRRRSESLDHTFRPYGLTGSRYLLTGRQYSGQYAGRQVNTYFYVSGSRYRRVPNFQIYVSGNIQTQVGIGFSNILGNLISGLASRSPLQVEHDGFDELRVYSDDPAWALGLLAQPEARSLVQDLMAEDDPGRLRALVIGPGSVNLTIRYFNPSDLEPELLQSWLEAIVALVEIGEQQPAPTVLKSESDLARRARLDRGSYTWIAFTVVGVVILCPLVLVGVFFGVMAFLGVFP